MRAEDVEGTSAEDAPDVEGTSAGDAPNARGTSVDEQSIGVRLNRERSVSLDVFSSPINRSDSTIPSQLRFVLGIGFKSRISSSDKNG